jgi:hypothetical protein
MPKRLHTDVATGDLIHEWTVAEYAQYDRNRAWHIIMITLGVALVVYGMFANNFLFSLIIILAAIIFFLQSRAEPMSVLFQVAELGVIVGDRFYPYDELDSFFVIYNPPDVKIVFFETKNPLRPRLRVPLMDMNPVEVRHTLQEFLPEDTERTEEPMSDMIARQWRLM